MENTTVFNYQYSAKQNNEIERIRSKYLPREENKMDTLRRLDSRVQNAGVIESLVIGIIGSLVFGIGMCFGLDVFGGGDWLTVLFCAIGASLMIPAHPVYKHIAKKTKERLTPEILRLSEEIMNNN